MCLTDSIYNYITHIYCGKHYDGYTLQSLKQELSKPAKALSTSLTIFNIQTKNHSW